MRELCVVLAAFGLAYIVGFSKISLPFRIALTPGDHKQGLVFWCMRTFVEMIECVACFGFWEGVVMAQLGVWAPFGVSFWQTIAAGCLVSATNLILAGIAKIS